MDSCELKGLRHALGFSQRELAFWLLGHPGNASTISLWERGHVPQARSTELDEAAAKMVAIFFHRVG